MEPFFFLLLQFPYEKHILWPVLFGKHSYVRNLHVNKDIVTLRTHTTKHPPIIHSLYIFKIEGKERINKSRSVKMKTTWQFSGGVRRKRKYTVQETCLFLHVPPLAWVQTGLLLRSLFWYSREKKCYFIFTPACFSMINKLSVFTLVSLIL